MERKPDTQSVTEPEVVRQHKANIREQWQALPPQEQAELLVELVRDIPESELGKPVRRELGLDFAETVSPGDEPIPTNWVAKEDLVYCRPDLAEQIKALDESEVKHIADKIGDALQDTYWLAMGIILDEYLGNEDTGDEDDEEDAL